MELVDVVYKSLTYFAILAVIVIVGSYVSYRVRRKLSGEKLPYEDDLKAAKEKLKEQKKKAKEKKTEEEGPKELHKPIILNKDGKKNIIVKKKLTDKTTKELQAARRDKELRRRAEEEKKKAEYERRKKRKVTKIFTRKNRIEILNEQMGTGTPGPKEIPHQTPEPLRARKTEETLHPKAKKKLHSLDENVLDKYANEEEDQFFTIKPKKDKDD